MGHGNGVIIWKLYA